MERLSLARIGVVQEIMYVCMHACMDVTYIYIYEGERLGESERCEQFQHTFAYDTVPTEHDASSSHILYATIPASFAGVRGRLGSK